MLKSIALHYVAPYLFSAILRVLRLPFSPAVNLFSSLSFYCTRSVANLSVPFFIMARLCFFAASILLAGFSIAAPIESIITPYPDRPFPNLPRSDAEARAWRRTVGEVGIAATTRADCEGQSCAIADLSGSTPNKPKIKPVGGDKQGYKCIAKYNPAGIQAVMNAPEGPPQNVGVSGALTSALASGSSALTLLPARDTGKFTGKCNKNILIFARGTTETGTLGITVGPVLNAGLGFDWTVQGVPYDADFAGDNCLGLPGGHVARDLLNQAAEKW